MCVMLLISINWGIKAMPSVTIIILHPLCVEVHHYQDLVRYFSACFTDIHITSSAVIEMMHLYSCGCNESKHSGLCTLFGLNEKG